MPDPRIYTDWKMAKGAAGALANAVGATVLQTAKGGKRVIHGPRVLDFPTWLAVWSYLFRIRVDQLAAEKAARQRAALDRLPWAKVIS
jgi:hypothetical protein